jgi:hypothetical protein
MCKGLRGNLNFEGFGGRWLSTVTWNGLLDFSEENQNFVRQRIKFDPIGNIG